MRSSKFVNTQPNAKKYMFLHLFSYSQMSFALLLYEAFQLINACLWDGNVYCKSQLNFRLNI